MPRIALALSSLVALASCHTYFHKVGYLAASGDAIPAKASSLTEAFATCSAEPKCKGITFEGAPPASNDTTIPKVYFKSHQSFDGDSDWQSYLRDYVPPPPLLNNPCTNASSAQAKLPWCDYTLRVSARVADMISRMTLDEKIQQGGTGAPAIPSLGLNGTGQRKFQPAPTFCSLAEMLCILTPRV